MRWLLSITRLTIFRFRSTTHHRGVRVTCLATWSAKATRCAWGSSQLSISCGVLITAISLPEWGFAGAGSVVVGWGGAEALLFLVMADEEELEDGCQKEEEAGELIRIEMILVLGGK